MKGSKNQYSVEVINIFTAHRMNSFSDSRLAIVYSWAEKIKTAHDGSIRFNFFRNDQPLAVSF